VLFVKRVQQHIFRYTLTKGIQFSGMKMTPAVEVSALEDATNGGGAEVGGLGDLIGGP
jgi:hypothetical protein